MKTRPVPPTSQGYGEVVTKLGIGRRLFDFISCLSQPHILICSFWEASVRSQSRQTEQVAIKMVIT